MKPYTLKKPLVVGEQTITELSTDFTLLSKQDVKNVYKEHEVRLTAVKDHENSDLPIMFIAKINGRRAEDLNELNGADFIRLASIVGKFLDGTDS
jgi:hypothetical protein